MDRQLLNVIALLASIIPGLGQFVKGRFGRGIAFFAAFLVSVALVIVLIGVVLAPLVWLWAMMDAYKIEPRE